MGQGCALPWPRSATSKQTGGCPPCREKPITKSVAWKQCELVYRERGGGGINLPRDNFDVSNLQACCYFLVGSGWLPWGTDVHDQSTGKKTLQHPCQDFCSWGLHTSEVCVCVGGGAIL